MHHASLFYTNLDSDQHIGVQYTNLTAILWSCKNKGFACLPHTRNLSKFSSHFPSPWRYRWTLSFDEKNWAQCLLVLVVHLNGILISPLTRQKPFYDSLLMRFFDEGQIAHIDVFISWWNRKGTHICLYIVKLGTFSLILKRWRYSKFRYYTCAKDNGSPVWQPHLLPMLSRTSPWISQHCSSVPAPSRLDINR